MARGGSRSGAENEPPTPRDPLLQITAPPPTQVPPPEVANAERGAADKRPEHPSDSPAAGRLPPPLRPTAATVSLELESLAERLRKAEDVAASYVLQQQHSIVEVSSGLGQGCAGRGKGLKGMP